MSENPAKKDIYCYAPFFHSHVDSQGENRLCCVANNDLVEAKWKSDLTSSPKDFWNSAYMKSRRGMMLNNESPPECQICEASNTTFIYKQAFHRDFERRFDEIAEHLGADHSLSSLPYSIDYRTAVCNLMCVMCDSASSTAINARFKLRAPELVRLARRDWGHALLNRTRRALHPLLRRLHLNPKITRVLTRLRRFVDLLRSPWSKDTAALYYHRNLLSKSSETLGALTEVIESGKLVRAYFAGGEPTLMKDHLRFLELLLAKNPQVELGYNTNLSRSPEFLRAWCDLLVRFPQVTLYCSLDAVGVDGEYLRYGLDLKRFEDNLQIIKAHSSWQLQIVLDATITSLGLFTAVDLAKFAIQQGLPLRGRIVILNHRTSFMLVGFIPQETRRVLVDDFEAFYSALKPSEQTLVADFRDCLQQALAAPDFTKEELRQADADIEYFEVLYPEKESFAQVIRRHLTTVRKARTNHFSQV